MRELKEQGRYSGAHVTTCARPSGGRPDRLTGSLEAVSTLLDDEHTMVFLSL